MSTANPSSPRRSRQARRNALVLALLATVSLSACGGDDDSDQAAGAPDVSAPSPSPSLGSGDENAIAPTGTPIQITVGDTELTARLHDNATTRDLATQLPLTLTFRDHNNVEKTAPLPRELSLEGAPEGHDPAAGDIGYWAPNGDLVFYYDSEAPFFNGIVRIGEFDGEVDALERQSEDFSATIERAEIGVAGQAVTRELDRGRARRWRSSAIAFVWGPGCGGAIRRPGRTREWRNEIGHAALATDPASAGSWGSVSSAAPASRLALAVRSKRLGLVLARDDQQERRWRRPVTVRVAWVWAVTSDRCGWFSGWRRADSETPCRPAGLTGKACVARRRPRTFGVT